MSQRGRDQTGQLPTALACRGRRRAMRITTLLIRPVVLVLHRSPCDYCPALSVPESANRENPATHWQNNTLSAEPVPHRNPGQHKVAVSHARFPIYSDIKYKLPPRSQLRAQWVAATPDQGHDQAEREHRQTRRRLNRGPGLNVYTNHSEDSNAYIERCSGMREPASGPHLTPTRPPDSGHRHRTGARPARPQLDLTRTRHPARPTRTGALALRDHNWT